MLRAWSQLKKILWYTERENCAFVWICWLVGRLSTGKRISFFLLKIHQRIGHQYEMSSKNKTRSTLKTDTCLRIEFHGKQYSCKQCTVSQTRKLPSILDTFVSIAQPFIFHSSVFAFVWSLLSQNSCACPVGSLISISAPLMSLFLSIQLECLAWMRARSHTFYCVSKVLSLLVGCFRLLSVT